MDVSKFRPGDWVLVASGAVMLVFGVALDWASIGGISGNSAFDYFFTGGIAYLLVVGAGVVTFLLAGGFVKPGTTPWPIIILGATALATLLMVIRLIIGGDTDGVELDRAAGMYAAFLASAGALAGAVLNFRESGGDLKDLTDLDKLKSSFSSTDRRQPPPPPPPSSSGGPIPPPPPPPAP